MTDPYSVLGVSRDATDDEVKTAYRTLARKYHPDNYVNSPLADLVSEKMKEINEAYDEIQRQRAASGFHGGSAAGGKGSTFGQTAGGSFARVRELINAGRCSEAGVILDSVPAGNRGAEWNFLKGCVLIQRGWYFDAQKHFEKACYLDPTNTEYRSALDNIKDRAGQFGRGYNVPGGQSGCSACDLCSGLICADCMCECCGGDLIRCC